MRALIIAAILAAASPAAAQMLSCVDLEKACSAESSVCMGYFIGVKEASLVVQKDKPPYCLPETMTNDQMTRAVTHWLSSHSQYWKEPALICALRAINESFPCGK